MRKNVFVGLIAGAALLVSATVASALNVTAAINTGASTFANGLTDNGDGTYSADLTTGDFIVINVSVENPDGDNLTGVFTSLTFDTTTTAFGGGGFGGGILQAASCTGFLCSPATLNAGIPNPIVKPNSPEQLGTGDLITGWIQAAAHANQGGTDGTGAPGGDLASQLAFSYTGAGGSEQLVFALGNLAGDGVGGSPGAENYGSVVINPAPVPEPGTALLMGLGLMGLGAAGRRK